MKCPKCGSNELYESGRDWVLCKVMAWDDAGWPAKISVPELQGGCYDRDDEYAIHCRECWYMWNPDEPEKGELGISQE